MSSGAMLSSGCSSPCEVSCPQPYADAWSQPCVTSCADSRAVVYPPPVVITFPGPILSSCPQESIVGSSFPPGMANPGGFPSSYQPGTSSGGRDFSSCYSRFSYPCYSRNSSSHSRISYPCYSRPAKPGKDSLDEEIEQKKEQIRKF
uniref:Keratin n=1 Tax=Catharus ustulatus TaxID=91951 RepID=A0A8C3Y713_CATUS